MANSRPILAEISANRPRGAKLSAELRTAIAAVVEKGVPKTKVATDFGVSRKAVYETINRHQNHQTVKSAPRSGRPATLSNRDRHALLRLARARPKLKYKNLIRFTSRNISCKTVYRLLKHHGMISQTSSTSKLP